MNINKSITKFNLIYSANILLIFIILLSSVYGLPQIRLNLLLHKIWNLLMFAGLGGLFFLRLYKSKDKTRLYLPEYMVIFFAVYAVISSLSVTGGLNYKNLLFPVRFTAVFIGLFSYFEIIKNSAAQIKRDSIFIILFVFIFGALFHAFGGLVIGVLENSSQTFLYYFKNISCEGLNRNTNLYGYTMMIGAECMVILFIFNKKNENKTILKALSIVLGLFFIYCLMISVGRGAIFGFAVFISIAGLLILKQNKNILNQRKSAVYLLISVIFLALLYNGGIIERVVAKFVNQGTTYRAGFWIDFINHQCQIFPGKEFFLGKGFVSVTNPLHPEYHFHNMFFTIDTKFGLIGLLLYLVFTVYLMSNTVKNRQLVFLIAVPLSFIAHQFFDDLLLFTEMWIESIFYMFFLILPSQINPWSDNDK